jgi:hypothetical protein
MAVAILAVAHANNALAVPEQVGNFSFHDQLILRLRTAGVGDHVQEIPLRYQGDVLVPARQPGQVGDAVRAGVELNAELLYPTKGQGGELLPQSQLVQQDES